MPDLEMPALDNTELDDAAALFARPHCPNCLWSLTEDEERGDECPHCEAELDADYPAVRMATAARLQRVAALAQRSRITNAHGWPVRVVEVRGVANVPMCVRCGCTELAACPGGCSWEWPDLCSRCADCP